MVVAVAIVAAGCSGKNNRGNAVGDGSLTIIDVEELMKLPVEDFDVRSNPAIASVEYFQPHDTLIYPFGIPIVGDSLMGLDSTSGVVTVFNRNTGRVEASFSRKGPGPKEYVYPLGVAPDFQNKEVYILVSGSPSMIKRYAFDGTYLDECVLEKRVSPTPQTFRIHNDSCLFVEQSTYRRAVLGLTGQGDSLVDTPFLLLNYYTGQVTPLPISRPDARIGKRYIPKTPSIYTLNTFLPLEDCAGGEGRKIISEYSNDTVYEVIDEEVIPIAVKTNWSKSIDNPDLLAMQFVNDRYMIFAIVRKTTNHHNESVSVDDDKSGTFIYDRQNNQYHRYADPFLFMESGGYLYRLGSVEKLKIRAEAGEIRDKNLLDLIERSGDESNWIYTVYHINE